MTASNDAREVAWQSWEEWKYVRKLLYSFGDPSSMHKGISFVNVWRSRLRQGVLPISVELTACLADSYLAGIFQNEKNIGQLHLSIAMSLVRFVNGITDQLQTGLYAQSVQLIADKINIPDWIVDIRHQATHSQLPSLELLQHGLMYALSWLQEHYWEETAKSLEIKNQERIDNIAKILTSYSSYIFSVISVNEKSVKEKKKKQKNRDSEKFTETSQGLLKLLNASNMKSFVSILCQVGHGFVMDDGQIVLLNISCYASKGEPLFEVLSVLSDKWKPIFSKLNQQFPTFSKRVLYKLSCSLQENKNVQVNLLISVYLLYNVAPELADDIIQCLLQNPSLFAFQILSKIMNELNFSKHHYERIIKIFMPIGDVLTKQRLTTNLDLHLSDTFTKNIQLMKKNQMLKKNSQNVKVEKKRWNSVEKEVFQTLPPMGEWEKNTGFSFDINTQDNVTCGENYDYKEMDAAVQEGNGRIENIIDSLFLDGNVDISNYARPVDYQLKQDLSSVDFDIVNEEDVQTENIGCGGKYVIDSSKISFF